MGSPDPIVDNNYWATFLAAANYALGDSAAINPFDWRRQPQHLLLQTRLRVCVVKVRYDYDKKRCETWTDISVGTTARQ
jgi:hypothetical protein